MKIYSMGDSILLYKIEIYIPIAVCINLISESNPSRVPPS